MFVALVAAQAVTLVGILAVSAWGRKHIDPRTRIRARLGTTGFDYTMSRDTSLLWSPIVGVVVLLGTVVIPVAPERVAISAVGLAIMVIFLIAHWSSVRRAAR